MCRRDLNTDSFRGCQFPQSDNKDESVRHLLSSRPSVLSGNTGAFSSSSASELSQLSDSSSKSTGEMVRIVTECLSLNVTDLFHDHCSPRQCAVKSLVPPSVPVAAPPGALRGRKASKLFTQPGYNIMF